MFAQKLQREMEGVFVLVERLVLARSARGTATIHDKKSLAIHHQRYLVGLWIRLE